VTFDTALLGWHDFYLASAGAAAALLGLLFVGVSVNISSLTLVQRRDIRERAGEAFANLTIVLVLSLSCLIPAQDARSLEIVTAALAVIGFLRVGRRTAWIIVHRDKDPHWLQALRRSAWSLLATAILGYSASQIAIDQTGDSLYRLVVVVFLLMIGAADVSLDLLISVSEDEA
jgi:hypothetical protein